MSSEPDQNLGLKLGCSFGLLVGTFICCLIPYMVRLCAKIKPFAKISHIMHIILDLCQGFAGGILLATGLFHLLLEGMEIIEESVQSIHYEGVLNDFMWKNNISNISILPENVTLPLQERITVYPYGMLAFSVAMLSILFLEKTLEFIIHQTVKPKIKVIAVVDPKLPETSHEDKIIKTCAEEGHDHQTHQETDKEKEGPSTDQRNQEAKHHDHDDHAHVHLDVSGLKSTSRKLQILSGFILWISLIIHSIFEGLGVGAARSGVGDLFVAIFSHHLISGFSLGAVLAEAKLNFCLDLFYIVSFSFCVPVGIWIGMGLASVDSPAFGLVQGIALSLAGGAFMYVCCFEILTDFRPKSDGWRIFGKMFLFILGFTLMACLVLLEH